MANIERIITLNIRALALTGALAGIITGSSVVADAQTYPVTLPVPVTQRAPGQYPPWGQNRRGERGSAVNLVVVRRRLERAIDNLQRDQRDYGGHRVAALNLMQQARGQLDAALQYDATNPGR